MSDTEIRRVALTDAIARLEHAIATRPFHTAYGAFAALAAARKE